MRNIANLILASSLIICTMSSCGKSVDDALFKDCILPWELLAPISQSELPVEIVTYAYNTFPKPDTITAKVVNFCNNEKLLYIKVEASLNYMFLFYNSCGEILSQGNLETDFDLNNKMDDLIRDQISVGARLLNLFEVKYENGDLEYLSEISLDDEKQRYLLDKDGVVLCKLF
ncbi:MAG: hypothetical protein IPO92_18460 [Saprospiraceae bacterium]|nr:hypothetical protein [Saprospiraceae bacterium]